MQLSITSGICIACDDCGGGAPPFMDESLDKNDLDEKLEEWVNKKVEVMLKERLKKAGI